MKQGTVLTPVCPDPPQSTQYKTVERVVQTLKNLCCALDEVETQTITDAVKRLRHSVNLPRTHSPQVRSDSLRRQQAHVSLRSESSVEFNMNVSFVDGLQIIWTVSGW